MENMSKRSLFKAGILSFLCPGLGHIYAGHLNQGIFFVLLSLVLSMIGYLGLFHDTATQYVIQVISQYMILFFIFIHCMWLIKRRPNIEIQKYNNIFVYIGVIIIINAISLSTNLSYKTYNLPSGSMEPTIRIGDYIYTKFTTDVKRGDVIAFTPPHTDSITYVKRIVGLPGETVEVINKVVYINDEPLVTTELKDLDTESLYSSKFNGIKFKAFEEKIDGKSHTIIISPVNEFTSNYPKKTVGKDQYFVLGDNRDFSADSRSWGMVPKDNIHGKVMFIYYSSEAEDGFVRFGKVIGE